MTQYFKLNEWIFIAAGVGTLVAIPFLSMAGFWLWAVVKMIYFLAIIVLLIETKIKR